MNLTPKAINGFAVSSEGVYDVHGGEGLPLSMFAILN